MFSYQCSLSLTLSKRIIVIDFQGSERQEAIDCCAEACGFTVTLAELQSRNVMLRLDVVSLVFRLVKERANLIETQAYMQ